MFDPTFPDPTFPARSTDSFGRPVWQLADGRLVPRLSGGDGPTDNDSSSSGLSEQEIEDRIARLPELTDAELAELEEAVAAAYAELREGEPTDETLAALEALADARDAIAGENETREQAAAERQARLEALDQRMAGDQGDGDQGGDPDAEGADAGATADASGTDDAGQADADAPAGEREPVAASGRRGGLRNLDALRRAQPRRSAPEPRSDGPFAGAVITASGDVRGMGGQRIRTADDFGRAFESRLADAMRAKPTEVPLPVMSVQARVPDGLRIDRDRAHDPLYVESILDEAVRRFSATLNDQTRAALTASGREEVRLAAGGPCVVRDRSFDVPFLADDSTPFTDSFATAGYPRGGVEFYPPLVFDRAPTRVLTVSFTDTDETVTITAGGTVTQADVGKRLSGPAALPAGTVTIVSVAADGLSFEMSAAADATAAGQELTLTGLSGNIARVITAAEDAAGYASTGGTTPDKACDRITCPTTVTCDLDQIVLCITIGNWIDRTFPEWVRAWRQYVAVAYATRWEEHHINQYLSHDSTDVITGGPAVFGATRDVLGRSVRLVEHITSARRLPRSAMWHLRVPDWFVPYLKQEIAYGADQDGRPARMTDAELVQEFNDRRMRVSVFRDEAGATAAGDRSVLPMPTATVPAYPGTVRTMLAREGAWVRGQGGTLDLSLVRDSTLNRTNDFQVFNETESGLCYRGGPGESLVVDHTVEFSGVAAGFIDPGGNPT